jgi:hypothetical protein
MRPLTWSSSAAGVATVAGAGANAATITAVAPGSATIAGATSGGRSGSMTVGGAGVGGQQWAAMGSEPTLRGPGRIIARRDPARWLRAAVVAGVVGPAAAVGACHPDSSRRDSAVAHQRAPDPADSLYTLYRAQLSSDNPVLVEQQIICERGRLDSLLGSAEAARRARAVEERAYTWRDWAARRRVDAALGGREFEASATACTPGRLARLRRPVADSLAVIARREAAAGRPIARSCAFRCEFHRLVDHNMLQQEVEAQLGPGLAADAATRQLDPKALLDSVIHSPPQAGCACRGPE